MENETGSIGTFAGRSLALVLWTVADELLAQIIPSE